MRKLGITAVTLAIAMSLHAQHKRTITISNPTVEARQELVTIPFQTLKQQFGLKDTAFVIKNKKNGEILPMQFERRGQQHVQNVLIEASIAGKGELELIVAREKAPVTVQKTYARYVPERKDDFAWENNVVAFRAYGKALEGTSEDAQGFDFWAKRTNDLIINEWYATGDYHADHGKGLDYYSVGQTLGVGDVALYFDDKLHYTKHYRRFEILDNGPLRSTFKLIFEPQSIAGETIVLEKTISLDAGSQVSQVSLSVKNAHAEHTPLVVGIAKRKEEQPAFQWASNNGVFSYWEPAQNGNITGTGLILPHKQTTLIQSPSQFLFKITQENTGVFTYYMGAAFNKAGSINSGEEWHTYLLTKAEHLRHPLTIKYNK